MCSRDALAARQTRFPFPPLPESAAGALPHLPHLTVGCGQVTKRWPMECEWKPVPTSRPECRNPPPCCKPFHLDGHSRLGGPALSHRTDGVCVLESHLEDRHGLISSIHFRFPNIRSKFLSQLSHYTFWGFIRCSS